MSYQALALVSQMTCPSSTMKLVLFELAGFCHGKNLSCWPSQSSIAERASMTREAVCRNIGMLIQNGFIEKEGHRYRIIALPHIIDNSVILNHSEDVQVCDLKSHKSDARAQNNDFKSHKKRNKKRKEKQPDILYTEKIMAINGKVIQMTARELDAWENKFNDLGNIIPLLKSRDEWLSGLSDSDSRRINWFKTTEKHLSKNLKDIEEKNEQL